MRKVLALAALASVAGWWTPQPAEACGGFFCGQQPVDQSAERIVFAVEDGSVKMITQISYQGSAEDFAWVVPVATVPEGDSLDTFPQAALSALDANTGPVFQWPDDCWRGVPDAAAAEDGGGGSGSEGGVTVHIREEVGPYDVAVVESEDPDRLVEWLRDNDFRVTESMRPYIRIYTEEKMKFLALKLQPDKEASDIQPFEMTFPGQAPSIPLRMTALAAEPEMGILVFVLGDMRYGPGNMADLEIDEDDIVWEPGTWPMKTNWTSLVAKAVDKAGGEGFVTEMAGATDPYIELLERTSPADEEQEKARDALLDLLDGHPYISRLYTRMAAEEMTTDPVFKRVDGGDVPRNKMLPSTVDGEDMCGPDAYDDGAEGASPCHFTTCGAGGLCREVETVDGRTAAACACAPGTTARTTFAPDGSTMVACQDKRMSFLNPGERELPDAPRLPDPCADYDCGDHGACVAMNMTPTCECERGFVAVGSIGEDGARQTRCVTPREEVPESFYQVRLPDLPAALPGGRAVEVPEGDMPAPYAPSGGGCSVGGDASAGYGSLLVALAGLLLVGRRRRRN